MLDSIGQPKIIIESENLHQGFELEFGGVLRMTKHSAVSGQLTPSKQESTVRVYDKGYAS